MRKYTIENKFGIDQLQLSECSVPVAGPGQVVVRIGACSLNYRDYLMVNGDYTRNLPLPLVPLSDGAGTVEAVGPGVTRWQVGDRVVGTFFQGWLSGKLRAEYAKTALGGAINGVLAEQVLFREDGVLAVPEHLSLAEAACLPCAGVTAWHCLYGGGLSCGDTVLVLGSGGVSCLALQLAKAAGCRVIATTGSSAKEQRLRDLGADDVINYNQRPDWEKEVLRLTDNVGVDIVVETGGAGTLLQSIKASRFGGHISLIGVLSGQKGEINPLPAVMKGVTIQGVYVGSRDMFEAMNRVLSLHRIHPAIDRTFPFDEAREALHYLASGAHFGKVVINLEGA